MLVRMGGWCVSPYVAAGWWMDDGGVRWVRFHLEVVSKAECGGEAAWRWVDRFVFGSGSCKTTAGEGEVVVGSN